MVDVLQLYILKPQDPLNRHTVGQYRGPSLSSLFYRSLQPKTRDPLLSPIKKGLMFGLRALKGFGFKQPKFLNLGGFGLGLRFRLGSGLVWLDL